MTFFEAFMDELQKIAMKVTRVKGKPGGTLPFSPAKIKRGSSRIRTGKERKPSPIQEQVTKWQAEQLFAHPESHARID